MRGLLRSSAVALVLAGMTTPAFADSFTLSATLTGDYQFELGGGVNVLVSVTGDGETDSNDWLANLVTNGHQSEGKLTEYYPADSSLLTIGNLGPSGWAILPGGVADGGGSSNISASVNSADLAHGLNVRFFWLASQTNPHEFLLALSSCSSNAILSCGQPGSNGDLPVGDINPTPVPEPASLLLLGTGLGALALRARRSRSLG